MSPSLRASTRRVRPTAATFPDMAAIPAEAVTRRFYDWGSKVWTSKEITVKIKPEKFSEGAMRDAHHMLVCHRDGTVSKCVAKRYKRPEDGQQGALDTTAIMQAACQHIAEAFNAHNPPHQVHFVDCAIIQREDGTLWAVEPFIPGEYVKHTNNFGFVRKGARNTPQAFTHFSYEFTEGRLMVVDMQGVGDSYTDPQIHTVDGQGYGAGNLGLAGMKKFLETHRCNGVCSFLQLRAPTLLEEASGPGLGARQHSSTTGGLRQGLRVNDFVGDLQPIKGWCRPEELVMLGLTKEQFDALVQEFNGVATAGRLTAPGLVRLRQKALSGALGRDLNQHEAFSLFYSRAAELETAKGPLDFRTFVLCWTNHQ